MRKLSKAAEARHRELLRHAEEQILELAVASDGCHGPSPSAEWLKEHTERLRRDDDAQQAGDGIDAILAPLRARIERMSALPCGGFVDRVGSCTAADCEKADADCPQRHIDAEAADRRERERAEASRLSDTGAPESIVSIVRRGAEPTDAVKAVNRFLESPARLLVLSGGVGTGKTTAAVHALRHRGGRFVYAPEIAHLGGFDALGRERSDEIHRCRLLVIDDLGAEYADAKGWFHSLLEPLLISRTDGGKRTLITTNLDAKAFKARYSVRICDRIRGEGKDAFKQFAGASLRGR